MDAATAEELLKQDEPRKSQLIDETAHNLGIDQNVVAKSDQNISNSQLWEAIFTDHSIPESMNPSQDDAIFVAQSRIIRRLADKKACIIIGLLANWVLRDDKHALKVFESRAQ